MDPHGRPIIMASSDHCSFRPSANQNNMEVKIVIATEGTVGLAEGIIEETGLVSLTFIFKLK